MEDGYLADLDADGDPNAGSAAWTQASWMQRAITAQTAVQRWI